MDGYHWVEDEFYLTSCEGEVVIGSAALLDEEGLPNYCHDASGDEDREFSVDDKDVGNPEDAQDEFLCLKIPPSGTIDPFSHPPRPLSGTANALAVLILVLHL